MLGFRRWADFRLVVLLRYLGVKRCDGWFADRIVRVVAVECRLPVPLHGARTAAWEALPRKDVGVGETRVARFDRALAVAAGVQLDRMTAPKVQDKVALRRLGGVTHHRRVEVQC